MTITLKEFLDDIKANHWSVRIYNSQGKLEIELYSKTKDLKTEAEILTERQLFNKLKRREEQ